MSETPELYRQKSEPRLPPPPFTAFRWTTPGMAIPRWAEEYVEEYQSVKTGAHILVVASERLAGRITQFSHIGIASPGDWLHENLWSDTDALSVTRDEDFRRNYEAIDDLPPEA